MVNFASIPMETFSHDDLFPKGGCAGEMMPFGTRIEPNSDQGIQRSHFYLVPRWPYMLIHLGQLEVATLQQHVTYFLFAS